MAQSNMLTMSLHLTAHPAEGIIPELKLKERMNSVNVDLLLPGNMGKAEGEDRTGVVKGILPDGSRLFLAYNALTSYEKTRVRILNGGIRRMCTLPGSYLCTLTILNAYYLNVNENNHTDYDAVTVLPFRAVIEEAARR